MPQAMKHTITIITRYWLSPGKNIKQIIMKNILLLIGLFFAVNLQAQEEISSVTNYLPYQDSLFILQTATVTNNGVEGVNDTVIQYDPILYDTASLVTRLYTEAENNSANKSALLRRAIDYRKINTEDGEYSDLIEMLGSDLDEIRLTAHAGKLKGNWRYTDNAGNVRLFELIDHPTLSNRLRMSEIGGVAENMNVTVGNRWRITVRMDNTNVTFAWSGEDRNRPVFYLEKFLLPGALTGGFDNSRWIKTN